jgi:DNA-binding transcriptional ArsR family regulator
MALSYSSDRAAVLQHNIPPLPRKLALFSETLIRILNLMVQYQGTLDRTFSALSDPTRRDILERLGRGPATIGELAESFGMSLTGLGKHVRVLEEARLVTTEKIGRVRECRLGPGRLEDATEWIESHRRRWERRLDRLEGYIEKKKGNPT